MIDLRGHVALITGGNSGIGLGMAIGLASAGADLAIWGTNPEKNAAAAAQLLDRGVRVHTEVCDVADEAAQEVSFARSVEALGKVDSVFANAGTTGVVPSITDLTMAEWRRLLSVNLDGAFLTLRAGARHMVERGEGGSLVAVSSTAAIHGSPAQPHYGAAKSGAARADPLLCRQPREAPDPGECAPARAGPTHPWLRPGRPTRSSWRRPSVGRRLAGGPIPRSSAPVAATWPTRRSRSTPATPWSSTAGTPSSDVRS